VRGTRSIADSAGRRQRRGKCLGVWVFRWSCSGRSYQLSVSR